MALLEFINVSFNSADNAILKNLTMKIESKDFISVVGPSGSGKSTFLKLAGHLISPTFGKILFKGQDINEFNPTVLRKNIAYCFQTPYLFGNTVMENINFPFTIRNLKFDPERVNSLFSLFHMTATDYLNKEVQKLSGGEKQRIALIRSILFKPEVLLLDEITSALDVENTKIVEKVIMDLNKEGVTVLWITHDPEQSKKYANKVLTIEAGEIRSLEVIR